jgi:hypothetical protein
MEDVTVDVWSICFSDGGIDNVLTGFTANGPYAMLTGFYSEVGGWGNHGWIEFYSIANPFSRSLLRHYQSSADLLCFWPASLGSHYAFYASCNGGGEYQIRVADLTSDPFDTCIFTYGGTTLPVGELGYNSVYDGETETTTFRVVDLSSWTIFPELGSLVLTGMVQGKQVQDGLAYLLMADATLRVVDVSNPADMNVVSSLVVSDPTGCLTVAETLGAFATADTYVQMLDLTDPLSPQLIGAPLPLPGTVSSLAIQAGRLYVGVRNVGLYVYDISSPAVPQYRGNVDFSGLQSLALAQDYLWINDGCDIQILPLDCITTAVRDEKPGPALAVGLVSVYPNPFNPLTAVTFALAAPGPVELGVYDLQGRLVRRLVAGIQPAGKTTVLWDGTDDGGRVQASGVYLVRFVGAQVVMSQKLVLSR